MNQPVTRAELDRLERGIRELRVYARNIADRLGIELPSEDSLTYEIVEQAARDAFLAGESCTQKPAGCLHRDCATARRDRARELRKELANAPLTDETERG